MRELSLHILDIVENSVKAKASLVEVKLITDEKYINLTIKDNGCGMSKEFLDRVTDPFTTTRTTRKVGLGLPLLKMASEQANGEFFVKSEVGVGTEVFASFERDNIDRMPLGDIESTIVTLLNPDMDYVWTYIVDEREFVFDTREVKAELDGVPIDSAEILVFLEDLLRENIKDINKGVRL